MELKVSGGLFRSTFTSIKAIRYRWKCTYKKPSTSSDYQRSSWNCKHFLQKDPIPQWTAMKEEAESEGAKGLQRIRKNINFRRHLNRISFIQPLWSLTFHRSPKTFVMGAAAHAIIFVFTAIIITILLLRSGPISRWSELELNNLIFFTIDN